MGDISCCYCYRYFGGDFVNIADVPIINLWFWFPDEIKVVIGGILLFLGGLAVWRIISG